MTAGLSLSSVEPERGKRGEREVACVCTYVCAYLRVSVSAHLYVYTLVVTVGL